MGLAVPSQWPGHLGAFSCASFLGEHLHDRPGGWSHWRVSLPWGWLCETQFLPAGRPLKGHLDQPEMLHAVLLSLEQRLRVQPSRTSQRWRKGHAAPREENKIEETSVTATPRQNAAQAHWHSYARAGKLALRRA